MQINLLPDLVLNRRREARIKQLANLALVGWIAFLVAVVLFTLAYKVFQDKSLENAKEKYKVTNARVNSKDNVKFRKEALEVQASLKALNELFNSQRRLSTVIKRVADVTPAGVKLGEININGEGTVIVTGTASSYAEAGKMVVAMRETSDKNSRFENVALGGANAADKGVAFNVTATFVEGPAAKVSSENR